MWFVKNLIAVINSQSLKPKPMTITIPDNVLTDAQITPDELLIDFAAYLYNKQILSIGQAKKIAQLDLISFQKELAKRNIYLHFDVEDLEKDLKNLNLL